jgi:hypothetical protein
MSNLIERALQTFWQTLVATLPAQVTLDWAVWKAALLQAAMATGAALLSAVKTWLQERHA